MVRLLSLICFLLVCLTGCVVGSDIGGDDEAISLASSAEKRVVPEVLKIQDNVERAMLNYSPNDELGIVKMVAPIGWTEPVRSIGFDIRGIIISGTLGLEFDDETPDLVDADLDPGDPRPTQQEHQQRINNLCNFMDALTKRR